MSPTHVTPPADYSPIYCATVHELCYTKMDSIKKSVDDIHGAVFGSEEQPGLIKTVERKVSAGTVRWFFGVFGIPLLAAGLVVYAFFVKVPLTYTEKQEFHALQNQVVKIEENIKQLPTATQIKDVMREVLKEHK
jgi:hypothetical protein